jgi:hypothetical protein
MSKIIRKGKIEKKRFAEILKFENVGDEFLIMVTGDIREEKTSFGECMMVDVDRLTNEGELEQRTLIITSNIQFYDWENFRQSGQWIAIKYASNEKNEKTKRTYKNFELEEVEITK